MFGRWSPAIQADPTRSRKQFEEEGLHEELEERFCKTLYYGELPEDDCPSLPLSDLAVKFFQDATPRGLGQVDLSLASSLAENAFVSPGSLITSMIYAKRLRNRNSDYLLKISSSDLFFISVMMASKYMYDEGVDEEVFNDEWAEAANLDLDEVNQMECDFLAAMDWQLFVSQSEFLKSVEAVERSIAWTQGCTRGWLSYTDINVLWHNQLMGKFWEDIAKEWMKVLTVSSAAYIAGVLTMVGSTALAVQLSTSITGYVLVNQPHLPIGPNQEVRNPVLPGDAIGPVNNSHAPIVPSTLSPHPMPETNVTEDVLSNVLATEEERSSDKTAGHRDLLEGVLPQLWAVVAFKDKFVQFLCAFSGNCKHTPRENDLKKIPSRCCRKPDAHCLSSETDVCPSRNSYDNERLHHSRLFSQCRCYSCHKENMPGSVKSNPEPSFTDQGAIDSTHPKSNLNLEYWCCHGNRPPDEVKINLDILQYQDVVRGFTTSVPVAA